MSEAYKISQSTNPLNLSWNTKCICGHSLATHGSNGMICAARCDCKKFVEALDSKAPKLGGSIP